MIQTDKGSQTMHSISTQKPQGDKPVVIVTGISSGIGNAVGHLLEREGWRVVGIDLRTSSEFQTFQCDVSDCAAVSAVCEQVEAEIGAIAAVVTAAGFWQGTTPFQHDQSVWEKLAAVHLAGSTNFAKAVLPAMLKRGQGNIVFITTDLALNGNPDDACYVTAKGAVLGMMRGLARETHSRGIRINSVAPGATDTAILPPDSIWRTPEKLTSLPMPRLIDPAEIGAAVALLCDPALGFSGQILSPNAGQAR